jgi:formylglycine-generating enzyme required for sulfatase activity
MGDLEVFSLALRRHEGMAGSEAGRPYRFIDTRLGLVRANKRRVGARPMAAYSRTRSVFVCERGIVFVPIAAAHFAQNSTKGAVQSTVTRGFWIAATEATKGQYALGWGHERPATHELELPATGMTWRMARDFCTNAAAPAGWRFDLPTEAQWDLVCSDGRQLQFNPPGVATDRIMWDSMNSGGRVRPVAGLRPTVTGVFDLHGNADEWCRDWWAVRVVGGSDPMGPSQGSERVFRGGSVANPDYLCDCSDRYGMPPGLTWPTLGFRVVLERVPE